MNGQQSLDGLPPLGSRWYVWGDHREVVAHATRDGEPAVRFKNARTGKPERHLVVWRLAAKRAVPSPLQQ